MIIKKLSNTLFLAVCITLSSSVLANPRDCKFESYQRFKLVEKIKHQIPKRKPNARLTDILEEYEIFCPWQVETDLNGDKKKDWVGVVTIDGKHKLMAYLSNPRKYQIQYITDFQFFPEETHLSVITLKELALISKDKPIPKRSRFGFIIHNINDYWHAYAWNGQQLEHVVAYKGYY